ncbi:CGNR zinc finger domain-containing protein [Actinosynnema sp.]|uniref:CGNR zinc finger domain-containing protein n=1 Tax=Actinosynnema sp. TaxID=1872144 RepID=UPI003F850C7D
MRVDGEALLLSLLNSTPVVAGRPTDELGDDGRAGPWFAANGVPDGPEDRRQVRRARDLLQAVVRGDEPPGALGPVLAGVVSRASVDDSGVTWEVDADGARGAVVAAVLAWDAVHRGRPGRLRACANDECARFLLDRSKSNNARWCSMAACGNKLKARRHYRRVREGAGSDAGAGASAGSAGGAGSAG